MTHLDVAIIAVFFIITLMIGIYNSSSIKTTRDYAVGNKQFSTIVLVMTLYATWIDSEAFMSVSATAFQVGIIYFLVNFGDTFNKILVAEFLVPKIDKYKNFLSVGEIVGDMYGKWPRIFAGISGVLISAAFIATQVKAISFVFAYFFNIDPVITTICSSAIVVLYSYSGGIKSVTFTDVFQFMALVVTIPLVCVASMNKVGGFVGLIDKLPVDMLSFTSSDKISLSRQLHLFFLFALPLLSPPVMQRVLMASSKEQAQKSFRIAAIIDVPFYFLIVTVGLAGYVLYPDTDANHIFLHLANDILPTGLKGVAVAGMLAIIMSSADSFMNSAAVSFSHDVLKPLADDKLSNKAELLTTKIVTIIVGIMSIFIAMSSESILELMEYSYNLWGPVVTPPLVLGLFGIRSGKYSFMIAATFGVVTAFFWPMSGMEELTGFGSLFPSILMNTLGFFIGRVLKTNKVA